MVALIVATAGVATPVVAAAAAPATALTGVTVTAATATTAATTTAAAVAAPVVAAVALPVFLVIVGADVDEDDSVSGGGYTYDCWKPVVRDTTPGKSTGKLLGEVVSDSRLKTIAMTGKNEAGYPAEIIVENIWDERFRLEYVTLLPSQQLALHAVPLN